MKGLNLTSEPDIAICNPAIVFCKSIPVGLTNGHSGDAFFCWQWLIPENAAAGEGSLAQKNPKDV
jgi:hypothetical protein